MEDREGNILIFAGRYIDVWKRKDSSYFERKVERSNRRQITIK